MDFSQWICSTWAGFHKDIKYLTQILKKNLFPTHLIERVINQYVTRVESEVCSVGCVPDKVSTFYFKLPYIGHYSGVTQKRIRHLIKRYCNNIDIKLIFSSFKIGNLFSAKDPIPSNLLSSVVYKFSCAGCNACYVGETTRHFSTLVREHLATDRASLTYTNTYNNLKVTAICVRPIASAFWTAPLQVFN